MLLYLLACLQDFPSEIAKTYPDNLDADYDLDGYTERDGDCNDRDPDIHPGAEEICDGLDNDCNETIDVDASDILIWYADADEDGFGDPAVSQESCTKPDYYVANDQDCDDDNASTNPNALDVCDDIDNDCNGQI